MRLSEYASTQRTYGSRKVPRSVQQSIPIDRIYEDGTWCCGNVYSQMWSMPDINFTMSDEDNKAKILNLLGKVYMGVPSDCWLKICIVSQRMDEKSFRENVLLHRNLDGLDKWRVERNRRIRQCVQDAGNVVQHKYLILSTNKQNVTDARSRLRQVQGNLLAELSNLGCTIKPMTNNERLEVLHNFFRRGEEGRFQFSFDDYGKLGNDFRNTIAPDAMRFTTQHAEIDDGFAKAMTIAQYPQQLSDNFVATLLQQVPYIVLSIDITPVETEDAMREIEASQMKIDSEKYRANRRNVENLDFMATISPRNQQQEKYTAEIRNAICEGDQQIFMVLLSVAFFADTPDELRQETDALQSAAANFNCRFTEMRFQQENCFNTAMPYGLRRVESSHMMLTRSVTALVPFVAQEVQSPQGIFYGRNAITGNLIVGDRTKLINGNAMVIATSGSGKSMSVKMEIIMEFLRWPNARFILVDPENEYELLVKALGGEAIKVSVDSRTHFNPLDYHYDPKTDVPPDVAKIEFVLSMLDKLIGENGHLQPEDRSLIAASLKNIYKPLIASGYTAPCPTLGDLYRDLNKSNLRRAKQLALMLDVFANGSLQAFSHTTNVDRKKLRQGEEYGSARWGKPEDIKPYMDPEFSNNVILTQTEFLTMNSRPKQPKYARNKNILVIGGSGSGKTRFFVKPNLMQMHSSYVVTDPKGTVLVECGKMLEKGGYVIKSLNTINFRKSMHYNPFSYIRSEKDILKLVNTIIVNTKGDGDKSGEDFWVKAEKLYYTALIGYIWYEAPDHEKNFTTLLEMINASEAREDDETFKNPVDVMFDELEARDPDHFAVKQYRKYKLAAGDVCSK